MVLVQRLLAAQRRYIQLILETQDESHTEALDSTIMDVDDADHTNGGPLSKENVTEVLRRKSKLRKLLLRVERASH